MSVTLQPLIACDSGFFFCMCVGGVIIGVIGVWGVTCCVWWMCWLADRGGQRTGPLSEEWLLTPDLVG